MRSHRAGDVRADDIGEAVVICGWVASRRDHGGKVFLDVRDAAGILQVVVDPQLPGLEVAHRLRSEWVVRVSGSVRARPEENVNDELPTGAVEVIAAGIEVLNEAEPPPFSVDERANITSLVLEKLNAAYPPRDENGEKVDVNNLPALPAVPNK